MLAWHFGHTHTHTHVHMSKVYMACSWSSIKIDTPNATLDYVTLISFSDNHFDWTSLYIIVRYTTCNEIIF